MNVRLHTQGTGSCRTRRSCSGTRLRGEALGRHFGQLGRRRRLQTARRNPRSAPPTPRSRRRLAARRAPEAGPRTSREIPFLSTPSRPDAVLTRAGSAGPRRRRSPPPRAQLPRPESQPCSRRPGAAPPRRSRRSTPARRAARRVSGSDSEAMRRVFSVSRRLVRMSRRRRRARRECQPPADEEGPRPRARRARRLVLALDVPPAIRPAPPPSCSFVSFFVPRASCAASSASAASGSARARHARAGGGAGGGNAAEELSHPESRPAGRHAAVRAVRGTHDRGDDRGVRGEV